MLNPAAWQCWWWLFGHSQMSLQTLDPILLVQLYTALIHQPARPSLQTAAALFAEHTIQKYQEVKQLHIILLALTLALVGFYVMALLRPLERRVNSDAGRLAGLLANVPPEVDVESTVRNIMHGRVQEDGDEEDDD